MTGYPISLHLQGKKCVVFGAGKTAQRRVQGLLQAGAAVTVIAPEPKPDCWNKADLTYVQAHYQQAFLEEALLVFAATNDAACNAQIVQDAQAQADKILAEAGAQVDARWAEFQKNADALIHAHDELRSLIQNRHADV